MTNYPTDIDPRDEDPFRDADEFVVYDPGPWDDDLYLLNQREADDYRDEAYYAEDEEEYLGYEPTDDDLYATESAFGYEREGDVE